MKKLIVILALILICASINATGIYVPKAPPAIPIIKATKNSLDFEIEYYTSVNTELVPKIVKGTDGMYLIPTNLAAKLAAKGKDIRLLSVLSTGLLSILGTEDLNNIKNLDGRVVYIGAQGSSPDVISRYIFSKYNIKPKIIYRSSSEIFKLLISKKIEFAALPEPLATMALMKNAELKRCFVLKNEWEKINGIDSIPQVGLFASKEFLEKNRISIHNFLKELELAVNWVNEVPGDAANMGVKAMNLNIMPKVLEEAIPYMNLTYIGASKSKESLVQYFKSLIEMDKRVLDKLPKDEFYENKIN